MDFNKILDTVTPEDRDSLTVQALKRQEYNRRYQAKLRERSKLITLEKKIDANLQFVIGYIKRKYASEYDAWVEPAPESVKPKVVSPADEAFNNWLILSSNEYKSPGEAFELSGLSGWMDTMQFSQRFDQHYKENNKGRFSKV